MNVSRRSFIVQAGAALGALILPAPLIAEPRRVYSFARVLRVPGHESTAERRYLGQPLSAAAERAVRLFAGELFWMHGVMYQYDARSTLPADDVTVILPLSGSGRLLRVFS